CWERRADDYADNFIRLVLHFNSRPQRLRRRAKIPCRKAIAHHRDSWLVIAEQPPCRCRQAGSLKQAGVHKIDAGKLSVPPNLHAYLAAIERTDRLEDLVFPPHVDE